MLNKDKAIEFFSIIDNEERAYWLGFLFADGYNDTNLHQVSISLAQEDGYILRNLSLKLFNEDITKYRPQRKKITQQKTYLCQPVINLRICSKKISKILVKLGFLNKKSSRIQFPKINKELFRHFIRGYFDGDGSVKRCKTNGRSLRFYSSIATNSQKFAKQLQEIILNSTGASAKVYNAGKLWSVEVGGNRNSKLFLDWIYNEANIFLKRKKDRYTELLAQCANLDKNKTSKFKYVSWNTRLSKWVAQRQVKGKKYHVGVFENEQQAHQAAIYFLTP